jgi:hypothetical protein
MGSGSPLPCICREMMGGGSIQLKGSILKEVHAIFDVILFGTLYTTSPFSLNIGRQCVSATERKEMASLFYSETINVLRIILCCAKEIWQRFMNKYRKSRPAQKSAKTLLFTVRMCPVNGWRILRGICSCHSGQGIK